MCRVISAPCCSVLSAHPPRTTGRCSEAAFDVVRKFEHVKSRQSINNELRRKYSDILNQYNREVDEVAKMFDVSTDLRWVIGRVI